MRAHWKWTAFLLLALLLWPLAGALAQRGPNTSGQPSGNAIDYPGILRLLDQGVDEKEILQQVEASTTHFTLDEQQIRELRQHHASDRLIAAMQRTAERGVSSDVSNIAIVLDCSGSMKDNTPDGISKMDAAKKVVTHFIRNIPNGKKLAFVVYGIDPGKNRCDDVHVVQELATVTDSIKDRLESYIARLQPLGWTPLAAGMQKAGEELAREQGLSMLVVITDGMETCKGDPSAVAEQLVKNLNLANGVELIGFGVTREEKGALEQLRKRGVLNLVEPETAADLPIALSVAQKLSEARGKSQGLQRLLDDAGNAQSRLVQNIDDARQDLKEVGDEAPRDRDRLNELTNEAGQAKRRLADLTEEADTARKQLDQVDEQRQQRKDLASLPDKVDAQKEDLAKLLERAGKERTSLVALADEAAQLRTRLAKLRETGGEARNRLTKILNDAAEEHKRLGKSLDSAVDQFNRLAKALPKAADVQAGLGERAPGNARVAELKDEARKERKHVAELSDASDSARDRLLQLGKDGDQKARPWAKLTEEVTQEKDRLGELADDAEKTAKRLTGMADETAQLAQAGERQGGGEQGSNTGKRDPLPNQSTITWNISVLENNKDFTLLKQTVQENTVTWLLQVNSDKGANLVYSRRVWNEGGAQLIGPACKIDAHVFDEDGVRIAVIRLTADPKVTPAKGDKVRLSLDLEKEQLKQARKVVLVPAD